MHKLPLWFHKISTAILFICEMGVSFGVFGTEEIRLIAFFGLFGLQFLIWGTGNFAFLNHMTVVMISLMISDAYLAPLFGTPAASAATAWPLDLLLSLVGVGLIFVQVVRIYHELLPNRTFAKILNKVWPYFLAHSMAIFAHMTTTRYEVVVEGSDDGENWKEYDFRFKPTSLTRRPKRVSPYQPRLDWLAWFLPFADCDYNIWFQRFLQRLLEGSPEVLSLMRYNPFPKNPPRFIRSQMYVYQYTTRKMKKKTGQWWTREYVSSYSPIYSLHK